MRKIYNMSTGVETIDENWTPPPAPAPTVYDVIAERKRRLSMGFDYDFGDARGVHRIGTTPEDLEGWDEVTKVSQAAVGLGVPLSINIVTDTGSVTITAEEWQSVLLAAGQFRQLVFGASFALQAMDPIPEGFETHNLWP